jgi:enoyl-CoA hydratase
MSNVVVRTHGSTRVIEIDRPEVRNAVDGPTAEELANAFRDFESSDSPVAVLTGAGGTFCSGADLKAIADEPERANRVDPTGDGPMGPTRLRLSRPVIAAIEGTRSLVGSSSPCGAIYEWRRKRPPSGSTTGAGGCR